ncbi:MAG: prenyltransferase [Deltaproteobacteria bacterium]|nr:MAG: prenyltransferase [Deltaproteobacteria bacterium]
MMVDTPDAETCRPAPAASYAPAMAAVVAFIRLGRPKFLGGGFVLYALGAFAAAATGHPIAARRYLLGQACVTAFQLMTHYANDYFDIEADRANPTPTRWSGGSRVLARGELPPRAALLGAIGFAAAGLITAALATRAGGPWTAAILAAIAAIAWEYSAPPLRLCAIGLGELATAIVVTALVPLLAFYLQAPDAAGIRVLALAAVPPFLLQIAMLLAIELPDAAGDAATGKRTLVVRLGAARAARLHAALTAAAFAWLPLACALGLPVRVALCAAIPAPFALWRIARTAEHRDPAAFERIASWAVALLVATSLAELAALATL